MKKFLLATLLTVSFCASCWGAPRLTADDFMPIIQAPEEQREELLKVQHPEEVKTDTVPNSNVTVTKARTVRDAINDFAKPYERNGIKAKRTGARRLEDNMGRTLGYVATGRGTYNKDMQNINAVRISQRTAYVMALADAKNEMSKMLTTVQSEGGLLFDNKDSTTNTANAANSVGGMNLSERGITSVKNVLKGYVTDSTLDDGVSSVYVTIVITPKTMLENQRPSENAIITDSMRDGINTVLAEIQNNLVTPVGGRTIVVPQTGEMGLVGFGSAIVQRANSPAARANQERIAEKIATIRAESELRGIIAGDDIEGQDSYKESIHQEFGDNFEKIQSNDPMNSMVDKSDFAEINAVREEFLHNRNFNEAINLARHGAIPPGVSREAWTDDEGVWAYAVAVYIPSDSDKTATDAQKMRNTQILRPVQTDQEKQKAQETLKKQQEHERLVKGPLNNDSGEFKPGVSGTIEQDL